MNAVFLKLLNLSITASWLILAVVLVRFILKKAPKWITCVLWALVAVRLVCPFSLESALSLIPSSETIPSNIEMMQEPAIDSGIASVNEAVNPVIAGSFTPAVGASANPLQIVIPVMSIVWLIGMFTMLLYAIISYIRLKKRVGASILVKDNILACDEVKSPFILGIIKPLIYVPSSMTGATLDYVITHETAHIKRHDHWWKPFGFLLLAVYWFNPLCWLAYILLCRDIEMACDEKVIRDMDRGNVVAYSQTLLDCSFPRRRIAACPLAFGEVGVKERVKSVLNYKKPAFWIIIAAVVACIVVGVCFLTNPERETMKWAKNLRAEDVVRVELTIMPQETDKQYKDFNAEEIAEAVALINKSSGRYIREPESLAGGGITLYVTTTDGVQHTVTNDGNIYLRIDGDTYRSTYITWPYTEGDSPLPDSFQLDDSQWDERPMLVMDGDQYVDPYKPESTLPHGYSLVGTLTEEQAYNTGLEGTKYYTNPNEPDIFYTFQLCSTPTGLDEVDSQNRTWQYLRWIRVSADIGHRLTLDDVRWLAQKGEALSWNDFDEYQGTDIGSGLYVMQYVIDDLFDVLVGGENRDADPEYIHLRNRETNAWVDIRSDDIEAFIKACSSDIGGADAPAFVYTYNVAYANWTDDNKFYTGALNWKTIAISSVSHLPIYKFDTTAELDAFKVLYSDILTMDQGHDEVPSFEYITAAYDDSFFSKYSLMLSYVQANSGSYRYGVSDVYCEDKAFCMYIEQLNNPESYTDDMAGWFVVVEVNKEDIADYTSFDAQLGKPLE